MVENTFQNGAKVAAVDTEGPIPSVTLVPFCSTDTSMCIEAHLNNAATEQNLLLELVQAATTTHLRRVLLQPHTNTKQPAHRHYQAAEWTA
jgi:hypothetical protein